MSLFQYVVDMERGGTAPTPSSNIPRNGSRSARDAHCPHQKCCLCTTQDHICLRIMYMYLHKAFLRAQVS
jgi:hypothetical protein